MLQLSYTPTVKKRNANDNNPEENQGKVATVNAKIRYEQNVPHQFASNLMPLNVFEQKDRFLRRKLTPEFHLNILPGELESALLNASGNITFTLFREATRILDVVVKRFKSIDNFVEQSFGSRITVDEATTKITEYIRDSNLPTNLEVIWCEDLVGSALMCSTGMDKNGNIPRHRKFTMLLKTNEENTYLRERGIICLMDHELGTHYHRSFNEGLQPWYGKREFYGLGPTTTCEAVKIEEGLACLHTVYRAEYRYLGVPALLYYGSCMAEYLPFKDLFEHLGKYVSNEEQRWKHCMRIKRCLPSQDRCGGYGKDQRYFEGAVAILRQQANIDFTLLMSGKLTLDELEKVRRVAVLTTIRLPSFMLNKEKYSSTLRQIARLNGIPVQRPAQPNKGLNSCASTGSLIQNKAMTATPSSIISHTPPTTPHQQSLFLSQKSSTQSAASGTLNYEGGHRKQKNTRAVVRSNFPGLNKTRNETSQTTLFTPSSIPPKIPLQESTNTSPRNLGSSGSHKSVGHTYTNVDGCSNRSITVPTAVTPSMIKNRLMKTLGLYEQLSLNLGQYTPSCDDTSKSTGRQLGARLFSKAALLTNLVTNGARTLPPGVCGCRLFTHGTLNPNELKRKEKRRNSKNSFQYESSVGVDEEEDQPINEVVPVVLEIDLRHPVIGV